MQRLTALQELVSQDPASPIDASQTRELDELSRRVPKIIGLLPDVMSRPRSSDPRHAAAVEQMMKDLIGVVKKTKPSVLVGISFLLAGAPSKYKKLPSHR